MAGLVGPKQTEQEASGLDSQTGVVEYREGADANHVRKLTGLNSFSPISDKLARDLVDAASKTDKPVCVIWGSPTADEEGYRETLLKSQVPLFRSARNCLTAVKAYLDYHDFQSRYQPTFETVPGREAASAKAARSFLRPGVNLSEHASKEVLRAYGIPVTNDILVNRAGDAVKAARAIGYPVVMKAVSPDLLHKSELGLVKVGLANDKAVREAYAHLTERAGNATLEGMLVSETVRTQVEQQFPRELSICRRALQVLSAQVARPLPDQIVKIGRSPRTCGAAVSSSTIT